MICHCASGRSLGLVGPLLNAAEAVILRSPAERHTRSVCFPSSLVQALCASGQDQRNLGIKGSTSLSGMARGFRVRSMHKAPGYPQEYGKGFPRCYN